MQFAQNVLTLDVCSENSDVAEKFANSVTLMSCSFQDTPLQHGHDWCDWDFGSDAYERRCTGNGLTCSTTRIPPKPTWMDVSPYMQCSYSPEIDERCVDTGITVDELGVYAAGDLSAGTKLYPGTCIVPCAVASVLTCARAALCRTLGWVPRELLGRERPCSQSRRALAACRNYRPGFLWGLYD
eukprot:332933-Rhodomonas_salina.1